jgi:orsellinic acid C2-O-methyltransferase
MVRLAAQMHLPDLLAAEPRAAAELATTVSALPLPLHRLLRGLAALGVFEELDDGRFTLTDVGRQFLDKPGSMRSVAIALPQEGADAFREIRYAVETGRPGYEKAFGLSRWEHLASLPDAAADFQRFMIATSERAVPGLLREFDFSDLRVVADVGGGHGGLLAGVLAAHPELQGILYDLPAGIAGAEDHLRQKGVAERCTLVAGDFFESVPEGADAYLLKFVLHDWQDEECSRILKRCRTATSAGAALLIVERLLPDRATPADLPTVMADIQMLVVIGGRERTRADFEGLLDGAGFRLDRTADLNGELHLLVARPV